MYKPYEATLANRHVRLFPQEQAMEAYAQRHPNQKAHLGMLAIFLFWQAPEQDYIKAYLPKYEEQIIAYDQRELAIWMGGVALRPDDQRILHLANREMGSFQEQTGWRPLVAVKFEPTDGEVDQYMAYQSDRLEEEWSAWAED